MLIRFVGGATRSPRTYKVCTKLDLPPVSSAITWAQQVTPGAVAAHTHSKCGLAMTVERTMHECACVLAFACVCV